MHSSEGLSPELVKQVFKKILGIQYRFDNTEAFWIKLSFCNK